MPNYDYHCSSCDKTFEIFQSMKDDHLTDCVDESCAGKGTLKRQIGTGAGIIFKGSGFYETDYRSDSYKSGQAAAEKGASKKTKEKETKSKDKPSSGQKAPTGEKAASKKKDKPK